MEFRLCTQGTMRTFQLEKDGPLGRLYAVFGAMDGTAGSGPVAQLSQMAPLTTARPHFHDVDQFHIFFGTPGAVYQRRPIAPVLVHYIDGYTPYGPVVAGEDWLDIITVRANHDYVTGYMPEDRPKLARKAGRSIKAEVDLGAGGEVLRTVIKPQADGLAAYVLTLNPQRPVLAPRSAGTAGQFYCVITGQAQVGGRRADKGSLGWLSPEAAVPESRGVDLCQLLVLQFPKVSQETAGLRLAANSGVHAF